MATSAAKAPPLGERAFTFGEGATMIGLTSEPGSAFDPSRPAVLILNAGIVHRIGPARNTVELARHLASEGFLVMRFDLSGIGDSESRRDELSMEEHAVIDVRQAMDHLQKTRGVERFVLVGLCSGADNALRVAGQDPRIVGAVLIDAYGYRTAAYFVRYYGRRMLRVRSYPRIARRAIDLLVSRARERLQKQEAGEEEPTKLQPVAQWERVFPRKEQFEAELRALIARDVKLLFIYTAGVERYYNYAGQLADSMPGLDFRGRIEAAHFADSDHTITELESKAKLRRTTLQWFARSFGRGADVGGRGPSS